ncbi:hypothetical protein [Pedobacter sp. Hv1]|uniref:hypothetical protein n=1 Tax=Pedobacter sp. Hv1 TaxID=1740090 RepID=UPI0006D8B678|nr:hypothetical protein [Pedobacter sp. Hv1]KQB99078.1 hypothetical protein AQF98_19190 [Pedobacter sp. Hv1]
MENQTSGLAIPAFLIIVVSTTETSYFIKYPLLIVAVISLIIAINKYHKERKTKVVDQENKTNS